MDYLTKLKDREPVAIIAAVIALIEAIIAALPLFGVDITIEQQAALMAVVVAVGGVVSVVLARRLVTPMAAPRTGDGKEAIIVSKAYRIIGGG